MSVSSGLESPRWLTAFLDFAPEHGEQGGAFWASVTGYELADVRGESGEFATLAPADGDAFVKLQRLGAGPDRIHLDVHVDDPRAVADAAIGLGATEVADHGLGYVVLGSPGGLIFCLVSHAARRRPAPDLRPGGHTSLLDQVCIDIPRRTYDNEVGFWADLTGWQRRSSSVSADYASLARPDDQPLRLLFQRLGEDHGRVRAHLDWATTDRDSEVERHRVLGARIVARHPAWTVLTDPTGRAYCVTDRDPATGLPPARRGPLG